MSNNKKHTNIQWVRDKIKGGWSLRELADLCSVSHYTMSRYFSQAVDLMSALEIIELSKTTRDIKKIISPRGALYKSIKDQTSYLPDLSSIRRRLWHIEHNTPHIPKCAICPNVVRWDKDNQHYRKYCGTLCVNMDWDTHQLKRENNNIAKYGRKYKNQTHISADSLQKLENKEWLTHQHKILKKSLGHIAEELNVHALLPAQYLNRHGVPGQINSQASTDLVDFIATMYTGEIIINDRKILTGKELDVLLPDLHIAFEYNGIYWHSELAGINKNYHLDKTTKCEALGYKLIHIFETDWIHKNAICKSRIKNLLKYNNNKIMARKCTIQLVNTNDERLFLQQHHIQGYIPSTVCYGLYCKNILVCVASFTKPRFNRNIEWELLRLCSQTNHTIQGGASKLFKHFITNIEPSSVISYSDKAVNGGGIYTTLGFAHSHTSKPNYKYFHKSDSSTLFSRQTFQKHKLSKKLSQFDPKQTEWENMKNHDYNRIWDCGNDVFIWRK
jgi:hypothetical protein